LIDLRHPIMFVSFANAAKIQSELGIALNQRKSKFGVRS
jgi:hypothetical protein